MKLNKKVVVLAGLLCLVPILFGLIFWNDLPDLMPTHFGMNGKTDGWSSKPFTVFGLPVIIMALHFLCVYGTMADPKKANISDRIMKLIVWLCPAISILCSGMMYAFALGYELKIVFWTMLLTGVVFIVVGNYLPKSRQNFTVGIKIPWTLNDSDNWNATHRFGGRIWIAAGVLMLATAWFEQPWVLVPVLVLAGLAPVMYSYLLYRRKAK